MLLWFLLSMYKTYKQYRHKDCNYSEGGFYFITICTKNRVELFGNIVGDKMVLSEDGKIAEKFWLEIPNHFLFVKLDQFVIMPNHIHGIINIIDNDVGTGHCPVQTMRNGQTTEQMGTKTGHCPVQVEGTIMDYARTGQCPVPTVMVSKFGHVMPGSISTIIGSFKSIVTKTINQKYQSNNIIWQSRFHDRIIRTEKELNAIRQYVIDNPLKWYLDRNNLDNF
jgi:REP element-mobilizing transposase RayT